MAGTRKGGLKARNTNYKNNGRDFYAKIGKIGGSHSRTGGFASFVVGSDGLTGWQRARVAGSKGGIKSKRGLGYHASSTSLNSLLMQAKRNNLLALEIKFENGSKKTYSLDTLQKLATIFGQKISFEQAWSAYVKLGKVVLD